MELHDVLRRPMVTEKSARLMETQNTYLFEVSDAANKIEVKRAVESLYGVKVVDVRTLRVRGKSKRFGRFEGKRSNWKKAYIKLAEGQSLPLFGS